MEYVKKIAFDEDVIVITSSRAQANANEISQIGSAFECLT